MGVIKIRTGGDDIGHIEWEVEISWKLRREIHRQKAIEMYQAGDKFLFQVDTDKLLNLLWPDAIKGWVTAGKGQGAKGNGATATATRGTALTGEGTCPTDEEFWETPMIHLDRLAGQVADWLLTGVEPHTEGRGDSQAGSLRHEEEEEGPLGIV